MKMPAMNFDFGPFTEPGVVVLSPYGIAVRSSKGEYLTYNAATSATAVISVSLHSKTFEDRFPIDSETKEYEIADRAFQLALMFVQTRAIAERGRKPSGYEFGKLLEETEYDYKIEEVKDNEA